MGLRRVLLPCLMAATALLICVYTMLTPPALVVPEAEAVQLRRGLTPRLILIDVDALRRDFGSNPSVMPNVVALANTGASGTAQVNGVSMSLPAIKAWTTGESFTARDIVADFWGIDPHSESVFYHAKKRGLKVYFSGPPEWVRSFEPSFADYYTHRNAGSNTEENDRLTQANALRFARAGFDVLAVHYINGDMQGHKYGTVGLNGPYAKAMRQIDGYIGELLQTAPKPVTILVMGDHGMTDEGFHWDAAPIVIYPAFIINGPGIRPASSIALKQVDVAPTLSVLLGTSFPSHSEGQLATEILDGTARDQASWELEYAMARLRAVTAGKIVAPDAQRLLASAQVAFEAGSYAQSSDFSRQAQLLFTASLHNKGRLRALSLLVLGLTIVGVAVIWLIVNLRAQDHHQSLGSAYLSGRQAAALVLAIAAAIATGLIVQGADRQFWPFRFEYLFRHPWQLALVCVVGALASLVFRRVRIPSLTSGWAACIFAALGAGMACITQLHDVVHWIFCAALAFAVTRLLTAPSSFMRRRGTPLVLAYGALFAGSLLARRAVRLEQFFQIRFGPMMKWFWIVGTIALLAYCVTQFARGRDTSFATTLRKLPWCEKCLLAMAALSLLTRLKGWMHFADAVLLLTLLCLATAWTARKSDPDRWLVSLTIALVAIVPLVYPLPFAALSVLEVLALIQTAKSLDEESWPEPMIVLFTLTGILFLFFAFGGDFVIRTIDDKRALLLNSQFSLNYFSVLRIVALQVLQLLAPCALFLLWLRRGLRRYDATWRFGIVLAQLAMLVDLAVSALNLQFLNRGPNSLLENLSSFLIGYVLYLVLMIAIWLASTIDQSAEPVAAKRVAVNVVLQT